MKRRKTPEMCDCNDWPNPSPWHCGCGRWKAAAAEQCDTCTPIPTIVRPSPQKIAALELEWYFNNDWLLRQTLRTRAA